MKTQEEIEQDIDRVLEELGYDCEGDKTADFVDGYVRGYTQCQEDMADKKYTKEDLENAFNSGRGYGVPDNIKDFNSFINSLNKQD